MYSRKMKKFQKFCLKLPTLSKIFFKNFPINSISLYYNHRRPQGGEGKRGQLPPLEGHCPHEIRIFLKKS